MNDSLPVTRSTRRQFLAQATGSVSAGLLAHTAAAEQTQVPTRPTYRTLYSNDTTNITSCVSPYHQKRDPISDDRLRASIDEAADVDVQLLQPGLGWIPWWQSEITPPADHYQWMREKFGWKPNSFGRYLLDGGDLIRTFTEHCRSRGVAPFVSFRLNDGHHVRKLATALREGRPDQSMCRFYWENYEEYRLGPDPTDWSQGVFNWAIPQVRQYKLNLIQEICENYDIAGLELDFMRHWTLFRQEETTSDQRCSIMADFVTQVRQILDRTSRGAYRPLCVRVPAWRAAHDALGVDPARMTAAGVDMINLSASYFTVQNSDLPQICQSLPETPVYLEMTHTTATGKATAGSGSQPYRRTTDEQFYTTAHLAYSQGATGVSLFNFAYYREHTMPELGPFCEPPFHVLPRLRQPDWLARQPQWYFSSAVRNKPPLEDRPLPVVIRAGQSLRFRLHAAPSDAQSHGAWLRLMAEKPIDDGSWDMSLNATPLDLTNFIEKPILHPHEGYLGQPNQYACFTVPRSLVRRGANEIEVTRPEGSSAKLINVDLVLP